MNAEKKQKEETQTFTQWTLRGASLHNEAQDRKEFIGKGVSTCTGQLQTGEPPTTPPGLSGKAKSLRTSKHKLRFHLLRGKGSIINEENKFGPQRNSV